MNKLIVSVAVLSIISTGVLSADLESTPDAKNPPDQISNSKGKQGTIRVFYKYTYKHCKNCTGFADMTRGEMITIFDKKGGCDWPSNPNDVAQCHLDGDGRVRAYVKDSCDVGVWGKRKIKGCSIASETGETVTCCIK